MRKVFTQGHQDTWAGFIRIHFNTWERLPTGIHAYGWHYPLWTLRGALWKAWHSSLPLILFWALWADLGMFGTQIATNYSAPSLAPTQINQTPLNIFLLGLTSEHWVFHVTLCLHSNPGGDPPPLDLTQGDTPLFSPLWRVLFPALEWTALTHLGMDSSVQKPRKAGAETKPALTYMLD